MGSHRAQPASVCGAGGSRVPGQRGRLSRADCIGIRESDRLKSGAGTGDSAEPPALVFSDYCAWAARIAIALGATSCATLSTMSSLSMDATTPGYPARLIIYGSLPDLN